MSAVETMERFLALQEAHLGPEGYHVEIGDDMLGHAEKWPEKSLGPRTIPFGSQSLPAISRFYVWAEEEKQVLGWLIVRVNTDRHVHIQGITSARTSVDANAFFDRLLGVRDLEWWRTRILLELVLSSAAPYVQDSTRAATLSNLPEDALLTVLGDVQQAATTPQRGRRDRITPDRLRDVAGVYRDAWDKGLNPTQEVAKYFGRPYSTASRWVVAARRAGILGPADSSRGGEVGPADPVSSDE